MFLYPIKISKETFKFYIMEITKENIKTLFYNSDKNKLIQQRMIPSYLERNHIPVDEIKNYYSDSESFAESVYRMVYDRYRYSSRM